MRPSIGPTFPTADILRKSAAPGVNRLAHDALLLTISAAGVISLAAFEGDSIPLRSDSSWEIRNGKSYASQRQKMLAPTMRTMSMATRTYAA
jgi:hypothetical protein